MFRIASFVVSALFASVFCASVLAQPTVTPTPSTAPVTITNIGTNHWQIDLEAHATEVVTRFEIVRATANDIIEIKVTPASDDDRIVELEIGTSTNRFAEVGSIVMDLDGLGDPGPLFIDTLYADQLGSVTANFMALGRITNDIIGPITLTSSAALGPAWLTLISESGDLLGDITVNAAWVNGQLVLGEIILLDIKPGVIGSQSEPVTIAVDGRVRQIKAGEINATIQGAEESGDAHLVASIRRIDTFTNGGATSGKFRGEVRTTAFQTAGGLWGMTLAGAFEGLALLDVFNQTSESTSINVPAGGMKGQAIILNEGSPAWNAGWFIGTGGGQIELRGTDYSPVGVYSDSAASIGGGTIGKFPFYLHATDCIPAQGEAVDPNDEERANNKVCMRHYGPVAWDEADGYPYELHRRKTGSSDSWQLQSCAMCEVDVDNDTIVWVKAGLNRFQRGFEYRVQRRVRSGDSSNVLRCKLPHLVLSTYPEVADSDPLIFKVCNETYFPSAPGDADDNGIVNAYDVDSVLENWSSTDCMKYGDADRSGAVNGVDLDIAELYLDFEYCYEAPSSFSKTADGFAQMDFDGDSAAMSEPMTLTQAVQYMGYEDTADFAAGFDAMEAPARAAARAVLMALISGD